MERGVSPSEASAHLWALGPKERRGSAAGSLSEGAVGRDLRLPGQPGTRRGALRLGRRTGAWVRRDGHGSGRASELAQSPPRVAQAEAGELVPTRRARNSGTLTSGGR